MASLEVVPDPEVEVPALAGRGEVRVLHPVEVHRVAEEEELQAEAPRRAAVLEPPARDRRAVDRVLHVGVAGVRGRELPAVRVAVRRTPFALEARPADADEHGP